MIDLTFHVEGIDEDDGDVRLKAFIDQLSALRKALNAADEIVTHSEKPTAIYRVSGLSHESPAAVTLTATPTDSKHDYTGSVVDYFVNGINTIRNSEDLPEDATESFLDSVTSLVNGLDKKFKRMWIDVNGKKRVSIDGSLASALNKVLSRTMVTYGTVNGIVERFNSHSEPHYFYLYYPYTGHAVKCIFPKSMLMLAAQAVEKNVTVTGELKIRDKKFHPSECVVKDIEIHPSDSELPLMNDLIGVAPDATGAESTFEFIQKIRDEWWH
ncbi:hypothetical protein [Thioalkalivibrio thiocyanodenitrificans]|uniref:hypothetical protein n=1 Tax=Thioalkalivibrio thiocyanodenitrificans TaxID=243063 RepID=UPI0012E9CE05|nr:hypothetical protein [Thioalkalivibrio thiocyanodenitrificans]